MLSCVHIPISFFHLILCIKKRNLSVSATLLRVMLACCWCWFADSSVHVADIVIFLSPAISAVFFSIRHFSFLQRILEACICKKRLVLSNRCHVQCCRQGEYSQSTDPIECQDAMSLNHVWLPGGIIAFTSLSNCFCVTCRFCRFKTLLHFRESVLSVRSLSCCHLAFFEHFKWWNVKISLKCASNKDVCQSIVSAYISEAMICRRRCEYNRNQLQTFMKHFKPCLARKNYFGRFCTESVIALD